MLATAQSSPDQHTQPGTHRRDRASNVFPDRQAGAVAPAGKDRVDRVRHDVGVRRATRRPGARGEGSPGMTVSDSEPEPPTPPPAPGAAGGDRVPPPYVTEELGWYARYSRSARIGYYILEMLAIGLAAAVPVATAIGTATWVIAGFGSAATAIGAARHVFGFDRNWPARAVTAERIRGRVAMFTLGVIDAPQLVTDVTELVDRETAGWSHGVRAALGRSQPAGAHPPTATKPTPGDG